MPQGIPTLGLKISAGKNLRCMRGGSFTPNISNDTLAQQWAEKCAWQIAELEFWALITIQNWINNCVYTYYTPTKVENIAT